MFYMFIGFGIAWIVASICILLLVRRTRMLRDEIQRIERVSQGS